MSNHHPPPKKERPCIFSSPAPNISTAAPSLEQLKATMENSPGLIKSSTDAHKYLEGKNYLFNQQENMIMSLTTVLLSLVVNTGP